MTTDHPETPSIVWGVNIRKRRKNSVNIPSKSVYIVKVYKRESYEQIKSFIKKNI